MSDTATRLDAANKPLASDLRVISLVGVAHSVSHFFHLIVAPLFPWLKADYGYSYTELGFLMTVFFVVSGVCQALAGFFVDRFGAGGTMIGGLLCLSASAVTLGLSDSYALLILGVMFAGLGNSVFHPVDFSILNSRVSESRLGPAYSVHGLSGSLGWALAPVFLVTIATIFDWRTALYAAAALPALVALALLFERDVIARQDDAIATDTSSTPTTSGFDFLRRPEIWLCFAFFIFISAAIGVVQSFAPSVYTLVYGLDTARAAMSVTTMMLASALGMAIGGWLVLRSRNLERNIGVALALGVGAAIVIGLGSFSPAIALALIGVMGFGIGLSGPSRDMLIRSVTPAGATGRVYGVVYSGLDVGIALAPVIFGRLLDAGHADAVFYGIAVVLILAIFTAWLVGRRPALDTIASEAGAG